MSRTWVIAAWIVGLWSLYSGMTQGWGIEHVVMGLFSVCIAFECWSAKHPRWVYGDYRKTKPAE